MRPGPPAVRQDGPDVTVLVRVQPRAARNQLVATSTGQITVRLTAPPVEGKANAACCAFLAAQLDLPKSRLAVVRGETARDKLIRIRQADAAQILARLQSL